MFVTLPSDSLDFSGVDPESEQETDNYVNSDTDSDSDWEDIIEDRVTTEYNRLKLKHFPESVTDINPKIGREQNWRMPL